MRRQSRPSTGPQGQVVALAWYTPDQWLALKNAAADPEQLDDSYEEWLEGATRAFWNLRAQGCDVHKVSVDVSELAEWCRSRGVPLDAKSRSEFAAYKAPRLLGGGDTGRRRT